MRTEILPASGSYTAPPADVAIEPGRQLDLGLWVLHYLMVSDALTGSAAGPLYSISPRIWNAPEFQALVAENIPIYALGTSTVHVGLVAARRIPDPAGSDAWLRATGIELVNDLRAAFEGTSLVGLTYDNVGRNPFRATATRMGELRELAPDLSLREWAHAFGVTKQAINNWVESEPRERPELDDAVGALRAAAARHHDLSAWLRRSLPGSNRSPLDLIRDRGWRALRAAVRLKAPVGPEVRATPSMRDDARQRREVSKLLGGADAPPAADDDEA